MRVIGTIRTLGVAVAVLCAAGAFAPTLRAQIDPSAIATQPGAALLYGPRHAITLHAPKGWTLDTRSGRSQGLSTVLYPEGTRWATAPAVIYCLVVPRDKRVPDVAAMMQYEADRYRGSAAGAVIAEQPVIPLSGERKALIRRFSGGANGAFEQVAYVEERTVIVMVVMSTRTPEAFERSLPAFNAFVGSYVFLADDPENIQRALEAAEDEE